VVVDMIRYRVPDGLSPMAAVQCQHPSLARLADCGPWAAVETPQGLLLTHASAPANATWKEWSAGIGGIMYQVVDPLPELKAADWMKPEDDLAGPVLLACGIVVMVRPACCDGLLLGLDGSLGRPAGAYGQAVASLTDRAFRGQVVLATDPQAVAVARMALRTGLKMSDELIHAWGLLSTGDVARLVEAAAAIPKAGPDDGPSSAGAPA
jgi:hypothetical protein